MAIATQCSSIVESSLRLYSSVSDGIEDSLKVADAPVCLKEFKHKTAKIHERNALLVH